MPLLPANVPFEFTVPDFTVDSRDLSVGTHTFSLEVVDDAGQRSAPARFVIEVLGPRTIPVAVLDVPARLRLGEPLVLNGERSVAPPQRRIVRFLWQATGTTPIGAPTTVERETTTPALQLPGSTIAGRFRLSLTVQDNTGARSEPHAVTVSLA